ncbi:MAG: hypothetical protein ACAI43_07830 [Phycisphaerae bacterium]|nr:hypothetical protein [Tepidisphaeraceae bacterium]
MGRLFSWLHAGAIGATMGNAGRDRDTPAGAKGDATRGDGLDPKERELAALPVGIAVTHSPNPATARPGGGSGYAYTWTYATSVRSLKGRLTVEEFGGSSWRDGRWVSSNFTGRPFTAGEFSDWYSCPGAVLEPAKSYVDPTNWSGNARLEVWRMKWYFVARTEAGERVKGEAVIEVLPEVAPE